MSFRLPVCFVRGIANLALCLSVFFAAATAYPQAKPDLDVKIIPPPLTPVYSTGTYTVEVANIGNKDAAGVQLTIQLPKTATGPQIYIMGNLISFTTPTLALAGATGTDAGTRLVGNLGTIKRNKKRTVSFSIQLPEKTGALLITANATTTTQPENNPNNNSDTETAVLSYYANTIPLDVDIENLHCTGRNLTAFFECTKFPGACSSHISRFHDDGFGIRTISFPDHPEYWGIWDITGEVLTFSYFDSNGENVANFSGRGVPGGYFEGLTTFPNDPTYVSPYRVGLP
ncbi:MAG: hypothetical protein JNL67_04360 [Planctomycetaceae bacterium]|nr:hypothetical protein [Planctomycetaceae bacterium]